ncbi:DUF4360 domain-containing protein [Actinomadura spongiicola]|uniref:DUF4360 domain-containing protein n=1 Tax=Actinomadura spongiicola TaxID=2303421 RepID=A0A372GDK5_9ACTN|nr:DUF4360 domain-containing protein [Actinomadura spongiicola]RFS83209.1 DUF4360 domain-containing protein [Actinomadura spongiicola]
MRRGIAASVAVTALALTAVSTTPAAASGEFLERGPEGVTIEIATVMGSGCPQDTAAVALSKDAEAFTITYSKYLAQVGGASPPTDERKNCQINLRVHVPQGFTYAVSKVDYRGFANLQPGATATQIASYYFQGDTSTRHHATEFKGPHKKFWQTTDLVPLAALVWSPCGEQRNFNINTQLLVDVGTSDDSKVSYINMDSTDGDINTTYHYSWKRCVKPGN